MKTDRYRKHHDELLNVVGNIQKYLTVEEVQSNPAVIRKLLTILAGAVRIHLAFEDRALYPSLLASTNSTVSTTAKQFMDEMSGIQGVLEGYLDKYHSVKIIKNNPDDFIYETKELFKVLGERIGRENRDFYPLVDAMND